MKVSDCCGVYPRGNGDNDTEDYGICPDCGEHCEYIEEDDSEQNPERSVATEVKSRNKS
jgi:transposase